VLQASVDPSGKQAGQDNTILWVGGLGGMEKDLVERMGAPYEEIPAAGLHGVGWRTLPGNLLQLWRGYWKSRRILRKHRPDVLFFTGGYLAVPMALAGRKIPSVIFVPDIEPGLAIKLLAKFADRIAVIVEDSRAFFSGAAEVSVTGYPVRAELKAWDIDAAREKFGLDAEIPTLLVFGGSRGARSINSALIAALPELLVEMNIIHVTGRLDWPEVEAAWDELVMGNWLPGEHAERYNAFPYLNEGMGAAMIAADLVVSRAGAATLGEFPHFGLPAILVPYPHAWRYQHVNAEYLENRGAAIVLDDADLEKKILTTVRDLAHNKSRRKKMQVAMRSLAQPAAAQSISQLLHTLVKGS